EMLDGRRYCFGGMKVGPTVRICFFSSVVPVDVESAAAGAAGGGVAAVGPAGVAPFLAVGDVRPLGCARCCIRFALSSVTMISPCCSTAALSSTDFSASDQVWPAALQAQDGLNSVRNLNAFGSDVYVWPPIETAWLMSSPGLR